MLTNRFSTSDLPVRDRFTWWRDITVSTLIPTVLASDHADDFHATAEVLDLGGGQVTTMTYLPVTCVRTPKLIRQSDPDYYQLSLTVRGDMGLSQARRHTAFRAGDLMLYDSSQPFEGWASCDGGAVVHVVAQFPKAVVPLPRRLVDRLVATRITADHGFADLLARLLRQVSTSPEHYGTDDVDHVLTVLLDLLAATVAHRLDQVGTLNRENRQHAASLRVRAFIQHHLGDPRLTPGQVAAAHHMSLRSLQRLFADLGTTPAAYIRRQRLEGARRDLVAPAFVARPIHVVAAHWGFSHPAHFTRAFRAAYGVTPREYRETAAGAAVSERRA